jgi:hypothetical protein
MHESVNNELIKWYNDNKDYIDQNKIVDIGSFDINGSVKNVIKHSIGFDIYKGKNVDVVIEPGVIPEEHMFKYGAATSISSFQFSPDSQVYKKQILDLLCDGGLLFLTMCGDKCKYSHTTSPNKYNFKDSVRYTKNELHDIFSPEFNIIELYETMSDHHNLILKAKKKC